MLVVRKSVLCMEVTHRLHSECSLSQSMVVYIIQCK